MRYTKDYTTCFKRLGLIISMIAVLAFGACSPITATVNDETTQEIPQYTLPPIEEDPVPVDGGSLEFPIPKNPATLNPLKLNNVELFNLFTLIYEQPIRIGADGTARPELAETWDVDDAGTIWTFHIREGVSWQKGQGVLTADDIIYTIDLIKTYSTDDSKYAKYNSMITGYTKTDDYTVQITMNQPGNAAIYFMTFPVLCKAYCSSGSVDTLMPLGTGPYAVVTYDEAEEMQMEASDVWWKTAPYIKNLTAICYDDHKIELDVFSQKLLDFITTSTLTVDTYKQYGEIESIDYLTGYYDCLVPNVSSGIFSDVRIRQAVAYALDKRDIISTALLGHAVATDYPVLPDSILSGKGAGIYEYNLQKAASLLEEAGWKDRDDDGIAESVDGSTIAELSVQLLVPAEEDDPYRRDVAENIATQLADCGFYVTVDKVDPTVYLNRLQSGQFQIALCSFYLDANPDISFMVGTGGTANYGGFSDATLDTLLQNCKTALKEDTMQEAYTAMENSFIETVPQISLYYRANTLIYKTTVNISTELFDLNIFTTIPSWYMYTEDTLPDDIDEATDADEAAATDEPEE